MQPIGHPVNPAFGITHPVDGKTGKTLTKNPIPAELNPMLVIKHTQPQGSFRAKVLDNLKVPSHLTDADDMVNKLNEIFHKCANVKGFGPTVRTQFQEYLQSRTDLPAHDVMVWSKALVEALKQPGPKPKTAVPAVAPLPPAPVNPAFQHTQSPGSFGAAVLNNFTITSKDAPSDWIKTILGKLDQIIHDHSKVNFDETTIRQEFHRYLLASNIAINEVIFWLSDFDLAISITSKNPKPSSTIFRHTQIPGTLGANIIENFEVTGWEAVSGVPILCCYNLDAILYRDARGSTPENFIQDVRHDFANHVKKLIMTEDARADLINDLERAIQAAQPKKASPKKIANPKISVDSGVLPTPPSSPVHAALPNLQSSPVPAGFPDLEKPPTTLEWLKAMFSDLLSFIAKIPSSIMEFFASFRKE